MGERALYAVVPAGGSGTRLWPLSRRDAPKFLHALAGGDRSLLQGTVDRVAPLVPPERTFVVTGTAHRDAVAAQLPELPSGNVVAEPAARNSAPAIGLAAAVVAERDPDAVLGSFAADHVVPDADAFRAVLRDAVAAAERGYLVTIGIMPTYAATGFGWIQRGDPLPDAPGERVNEFTEKPPAELAQRYLDSGRSLWNASMFVWRVGVFLAELARQLPALHDGLTRIAKAWDGPDRDAVLREAWATLPAATVDDGVMVDAARRGRVAVVPGTFEWHDIGDWNGLAELLASGGDGNVDLGTAPRLSVDDTGTLVAADGGRLVATLGLRDVVVVDTPDAVLVVPRDRAQDVRRLVEELKRRGDDDHL
ncbi:MAG: mannose-1-phosphate guanylyltransferase [Streptosporangiales bacterium]|nr:mannose-1-phosphate guanylyltransferase [Streptosporangiales bacterium]MBO0892293.1 mannose-1-phosphate guanylyltransferase [Acidothermales bacterium]